MKRDFTKGVSVERVKPLALLGHCKAEGMSKKMSCEEVAQELGNEKERWRREILVRYAKRLLGCSERIFEDDRLFHTQIPLTLNGMERTAYGIYEGSRTTLSLGKLIDWWENYKCSQVEDENGELHYICGVKWAPRRRFAKCDGESEKDRVIYIGRDNECYSVAVDRPVIDLQCSINEVCKRYPERALRHNEFDLEDAIEHLLGEKVYKRL